jgi:hypothetical protein
VMVFGGSSVTAGHDNLMNQSYPLIYQKRMKPTFQSLGIDLIVHNIAQGDNECIPSDLCYETMGGYQSDFYSWCAEPLPLFHLPSLYLVEQGAIIRLREKTRVCGHYRVSRRQEGNLILRCRFRRSDASLQQIYGLYSLLSRRLESKTCSRAYPLDAFT